MAEMVKMVMEMPFGLWTWMGPRNHVVDGGRDHPWDGAIFEERGAHCKVSAMSCAKTAETIDFPFGW